MQDERASGGGSTVVGSYGYTPFEQFSGRALPASDIYSLGVTLIQLLSGKDPARLPKQQMRIDFREDIDPSAGLSLVLEKMIDPDWQRRYRSATALKKELVRVRRGELPSHGTSYKIKVVVATFLITFLLTTIFAGRIPIYSDYFARQLSTDEEQGENVARDKPENLYRRRFLCSQFVHSGMPRLGANLVKNPNLEGPCGWGFASGVEMRHLDSESPYSGEYSFALRKNDKAWQWVHPIWWNDFLRRQIEQKVYSIEVSARVRSSKGSIQGSPIVSVTLYEIIKPNPVTPKNYKEIKFIPIMELDGFPTAASTEWRERSMSWLLPPNAQHIKIYLERYTDKGDDSENIAFFDDIEVVPELPASSVLATKAVAHRTRFSSSMARVESSFRALVSEALGDAGRMGARSTVVLGHFVSNACLAFSKTCLWIAFCRISRAEIPKSSRSIRPGRFNSTHVTSHSGCVAGFCCRRGLPGRALTRTSSSRRSKLTFKAMPGS